MARLDSPDSGACEWSQDENSVSLWYSDCGKRLWLGQTGSPRENEMEFCCFCGETLFEADDEDDE